MSASIATIRRLEELGFNAWPALQTMVQDGWLLRFADGYTKRANSVNAWMPGETPIAKLIADAEAAYAARGQRAIFRLTPLAPAALDEELETRGYAKLDETLVQCADLPTETARDPDIEIVHAPSPAWLAGYTACSGLRATDTQTLERMLRSVPAPAAFAVLRVDGAALAFGYAACERGHIGLFDIVTHRDSRRRGFGRRVVMRLMGWGRQIGAGQAYLQVVAANAPARRLYAALGFRTVYGYHYRMARA